MSAVTASRLPGWKPILRNPEPALAPPIRHGGFTLLELLMAIAVFAVLSAMAYGGLASVLAVRHTLERQADELAALQMTLYRLGTDLEQAVNRTHRDENARSHPPFVGGEGLDYVLKFTRSGRTNPRKLARSGLERVAYALEEEVVRRYAWPTLDGFSQENPLSSTLLQGVLAVEIRFLDHAGRWQPFWPPDPDASEAARPTSLPNAVEIVIEKRRWGRIRRLFEVMPRL